MHVVETHTPEESHYDMIIGTDLKQELGGDTSFKEKTVTRKGHTLPVRDRGIVATGRV